MKHQDIISRLVDLLGTNRVTYLLVPNMGHGSDPLYSDEQLGLLEAYLRDKLVEK